MWYRDYDIDNLRDRVAWKVSGRNIGLAAPVIRESDMTTMSFAFSLPDGRRHALVLQREQTRTLSAVAESIVDRFAEWLDWKPPWPLDPQAPTKRTGGFMYRPGDLTAEQIAELLKGEAGISVEVRPGTHIEFLP